MVDIDLSCYKGISSDSRNVRDGFIFVAIKGECNDGHNFISEAIERGAALIVAQEKIDLLNNNVKIVEDTRSFFYKNFCRYYNVSDNDFVSIGVTGTNGKTTLCYLIEHLLSHLNQNCLLCGTINYRIKGVVVGSSTTTPGLEDFLYLLRGAKNAGVKHLCMEVSSHALVQRRIGDFHFNVGVFTNLSQDHLDYHKDMESYFKSKQLLFNRHIKPSGSAVINISNYWGRQLFKLLDGKLKLISVGKDQGDIRLKELDYDITGMNVSFCYNQRNYRFFLPMIGEHNAMNALTALAVMVAMGQEVSDLLGFFSDFAGVPGRLERLEVDGRLVFIDYAHTPQALETVLSSLKRLGGFNRLIVVFGCGGDRDKEKRPIMGKIADRLADIVIITSDNPRSEDPENIINQIIAGIGELSVFRHIIEPDRYRAIHLALDMAEEGDIVLIAGKGHEDYQIVQGRKYHFSDKEAVLEWERRLR